MAFGLHAVADRSRRPRDRVGPDTIDEWQMVITAGAVDRVLGVHDVYAIARRDAAPRAFAGLWAVSRAVNNVRNKGPALLERIGDPHAPPPSGAPAGANPG